MDIKEIRSKLGLTQEEFARKLGISVFTVSKWERGETKPSRMAEEKIGRLRNKIAINITKTTRNT